MWAIVGFKFYFHIWRGTESESDERNRGKVNRVPGLFFYCPKVTIFYYSKNANSQPFDSLKIWFYQGFQLQLDWPKKLKMITKSLVMSVAGLGWELEMPNSFQKTSSRKRALIFCTLMEDLIHRIWRWEPTTSGPTYLSTMDYILELILWR